jgi:hypothetical protein
MQRGRTGERENGRFKSRKFRGTGERKSRRLGEQKTGEQENGGGGGAEAGRRCPTAVIMRAGDPGQFLMCQKFVDGAVKCASPHTLMAACGRDVCDFCEIPRPFMVHTLVFGE